jgi:subtilisin family serine protease
VARCLERDFAPRGGIGRCHRFRHIPSLLVEVRDPACIEALERLDGVESVHLDGRGHGALGESAPFIRAGEAGALGLSGAGTVAAVLDTGIDAAHPSFAGAILEQHHFLEQTADSGPGAADGHGHGTNVAGIIASRGVRAPRGIAPGVHLVVVKVLDDQNAGWVSDWTAGVEHVISLHLAAGGIRIDAINMSFATEAFYRGGCDGDHRPFLAACRRAAELGIAVFAAAGNRRSVDEELGLLPIPACYSPVLAVGSVLDTAPDRISWFTMRSGLVDLLAPGQNIASTGLGGRTSTFAGTSQAAPHAAAVACLLREALPEISPGEIREILERTGRPFTDGATGIRFPILDARAAVEAALVPRLEDVHCTADAGTVAAAWSAGAGIDNIAARVLLDGEAILEQDLDGAETGFRFAASAAGAYTVCLRPAGAGGLGGLEECCGVEVGGEPRRFVRGECNGSAALDISDPVFFLNPLVLAGPRPPCLEACNTNADGRLDVSDASHALGYLYLGGPPPPPPFPGCGAAAAGESAVGCAAGRCP